MAFKDFGDLVFLPHTHPQHRGGIKAAYHFDNGYTVSVIKTPKSHGGESGFYELAVLIDGRLFYETGIFGPDVAGWLTKEAVSEIMKKVQQLPRVGP